MTTKRTAAAGEVDRQLARYRSMRDFTVTAEPAGGQPIAPGALPFVIQKHAASRLHYDLRLGWNGVLKSWAVAKGPSYTVKDKRLAVEVEDHPMEYGGFEGIIPAGQYGGGTVMVWDQGTWQPQPGHEDIDAGLRAGSLKFTLDGAKMKGRWTLVRMGGKAARESRPNWLLIKEHDEFERGEGEPAIVDDRPDSAVTGRTMEEIAASEDHVWNSKETARGDAWYRRDGAAGTEARRGGTRVASGRDRQKGEGETQIPFGNDKQKSKKSEGETQIPFGNDRQKSKGKEGGLADAPLEPLPAFVPPQLAAHAAAPPTGAGWLHELKLDGYRIQARKQGSTVRLLTRTGLDWTHRMKPVAASVAALPARDALLDGELVVLGEDGTTSFADLQAAFRDGGRGGLRDGVKKPLTYFVFDLVHLDGHDLRGLPLLRRKRMLADLLGGAEGDGVVRLSEHLDTGGATMFRKACELHAEGIVSKRADGRYLGGRGGDWLKLKCIEEQEFVVGGFTLPAKGRAGTEAIGALLLGYYTDAGKLVYAGRTGTGFTAKSHRTVRGQMEALRRAACPFDRPPAEARAGAIWVEPRLVAQVRFATWTADNLLRQASFKGFREDKAARQVRREQVARAVHPAQTPGVNERQEGRKQEGRDEGEKGGIAGERDGRGEGAGAPVRLTHPDKVVDPGSGLTKRQLADYYWAIAPEMLAHVADRPLSLVRCPDGTGKPCFFQKHASTMLPPELRSIDVPDRKTGKLEPYITLSTPEALASLAQMGVLEVHPWGSRNEDLEHPDRITIDLDPDEAVSWAVLAESADEVRGRLKKLGLASFVKTTGGKGLHVVVPVEPVYDWSVVKQFAHAFVLGMERAAPTRYLTKMTKAARANRIYLDYLRNERGATAVAAYSPRARAAMAVSLPLAWTELKLAERPVFRVADFAGWRGRLSGRPWKRFGAVRQRIAPEMLAAYRIAP